MSPRWEIPESWRWAEAADVAEVIGGGTPSTGVATHFGGDIPWVTPADMSTHEGKHISGGSRTLSIAGLAASGARWLPAGAVLFSSRAPIGYCAIAARPLTTNQGFKSFVPYTGLRPEYLLHWLRSAKPIAEELASGTTFLELSGSKAATLPVPLAPEPEQTRIVDALDAVLDDLGEAVGELHAAKRKLALYRQSLLKSAVEGMLTAEWRDCQTGPTSNSVQEPVGCDEGPWPLPPSWRWCSLESLICDGPQNGLYLPAERYGAGFPILRIDDYQVDRVPERSALRQVRAENADAVRYALAPGDLVINRVNSMTHLGKCIAISDKLAGALFESNMMRLHLKLGVSPRFVASYLGAAVGRALLIAGAKWAVNQASINQQDVRRTPVPLPPWDEQVEIERLLDMHLAAASDQGASIDRALAQASAQRQNILRAAFSGQLVPQDPNDEPASVLLERFRAQRKADAGKPAPRRPRKVKIAA